MAIGSDHASLMDDLEARVFGVYDDNTSFSPGRGRLHTRGGTSVPRRVARARPVTGSSYGREIASGSEWAVPPAAIGP